MANEQSTNNSFPKTPPQKVRRLSQLSPDGKLLQKHNPKSIHELTVNRPPTTIHQNSESPFFIEDSNLLKNPDGRPKPIVRLYFKRINLGPFYIIWTSTSNNEGTYIMELNTLVDSDTPEAEAFRSITGFKSPLVNRRQSSTTNKALKQKRGSAWGWKAIVCWNHSNTPHAVFVLNTLHHIAKCLNYLQSPMNQKNYAYHLEASDKTNLACDVSLDKVITDYDVRKVLHYYYYYPFLVKNYWIQSKHEYNLPRTITSSWYRENPSHRSFFFSPREHNNNAYSAIAQEFGFPSASNQPSKRRLTVTKTWV